MLRKSILIAMFSAIFIIGSITILSFDGTAESNYQNSLPLKWRNLKLKLDTPRQVKDTKRIDLDDQNTPKTIDLNPNTNEIGPSSDISSRINRIDKVYKENEALNKERANAVRDAMKHAWKGYEKYAWGGDELSPISKGRHQWMDLGISIVDSLDTLLMMDLKDEFEKAREWVEKEYNPKQSSRYLSVFEVIIRFLGGFLSTYELTQDKLFLDKAEEMGKLLLNAFDKSSIFPKKTLNLATGNGDFGDCAVLAEFGTVFLEFNHLSKLTGNPIWAEKSDAIVTAMDKIESQIPGLYPHSVRFDASGFCNNEISLGAMGDSFYEYLLKMWIYYGNGKDPKAARYQRMYMETATSAIKHLYKVSPKGQGYATNLNNNRPTHAQEHLSCFSGGMFGLGAAMNVSGNEELNDRHMQVAREITKTCAETYRASPSGLGPEKAYIDPATGNIHTSGHETVPWYLLRPETIESLFILYRVTGDTLYQDYGWEIFEALEKHCKIASGGYTGLRDVNNPESSQDNVQQSFFLAETLKYLYLLYTDSSVIPLDKYVFNTEAHPLPIQF
eukprot:gene2399-2966_t